MKLLTRGRGNVLCLLMSMNSGTRYTLVRWHPDACLIYSDDFEIKLGYSRRLYYRVYCDSEAEVVGTLLSSSSFLLLRSCWNQIFSPWEIISTSHSHRDLQVQTCNVKLCDISLSSRVGLWPATCLACWFTITHHHLLIIHTYHHTTFVPLRHHLDSCGEHCIEISNY